MQSFGVLLTNGLGGYLYSSFFEIGPFCLGYSGIIILTVLAMALGRQQKLNI